MVLHKYNRQSLYSFNLNIKEWHIAPSNMHFLHKKWVLVHLVKLGTKKSTLTPNVCNIQQKYTFFNNLFISQGRSLFVLDATCVYALLRKLTSFITNICLYCLGATPRLSIGSYKIVSFCVVISNTSLSTIARLT